MCLDGNATRFFPLLLSVPHEQLGAVKLVQQRGLAEVVIERVDQMEKIIEHPRLLRAQSLTASPFVRHNLRPIPTFR